MCEGVWHFLPLHPGGRGNPGDSWI